jgi:hypothetical protein
VPVVRSPSIASAVGGVQERGELGQVLHALGLQLGAVDLEEDVAQREHDAALGLARLRAAALSTAFFSTPAVPARATSRAVLRSVSATSA